jgi:hypothetical protein
MKKLLALLLVVGMASAADAAVVGLSVDGATVSDGTEDISPGETITLYVVSDTANYPWLMEVSVLVSDATLGAPIFSTGAGTMAGYVDYSDSIMWVYELSTAGAPGSIMAGLQWSMDLTAIPPPAPGWFTVNLGPYGEAPVSSIEFFVPEPVTIALLGLGGLLVLRRRK